MSLSIHTAFSQQTYPRVSLPSGLSSSGNAVTSVIMLQPISNNTSATPGVNAYIQRDYFDGLGYKIKSIDYARGGASEDVCTDIIYDERYRCTATSIPYCGNGTTLASEGICSLYTYEEGRRSRVLTASRPGDSSHPAVTNYRYNTSADAVMQLYVKNNGFLYRLQDYQPGTLNRVCQQDEDGKTIVKYYDQRDSLILVRPDDDPSLGTYYVYDSRGQLCYVLPPDAWTHITSVTPGRMVSFGTPYSLFLYHFTYDNKGRCRSAQRPGGQKRYYTYDKDGLLWFDSSGSSSGEGTFSIYDECQRPVMQGHLFNCSTGISYVNGTAFHYVAFDNTKEIGYEMPFSSLTKDSVDIIYYYDNYSFLNLSAWSSKSDSLSFCVTTATPSCLTAPKGKLTGKAVRVLGTDDFLLKTFYYDARYRIVQTHENNYLGGYESYYASYDFVGNPTNEIFTHSTDSGGFYRESSAHTYDGNALRPTSLTQTVNGRPTTTTFSYDSIGNLHGQSIHAGMYSLSHNYDIQGRLTETISDYFNQNLYYGSALSNSDGYHNGNIHDVSWKIGSQASAPLRHYTYTYDGLNRLTSAEYDQTPRHCLYLRDSVRITLNNPDYSTSYAYDKEGNLTKILRYGLNRVVHPSNNVYYDYFGVLDSLNIRRNGNRVVGVTDSVDVLYSGIPQFVCNSSESTTHSYDAKGRLTEDLTRNISKIAYNYLNLPDSVVFSNDHRIRYLYAADGRKLRTTYDIRIAVLVNPNIEFVDPLFPSPVLNPDTSATLNPHMIYRTSLRRDYSDGHIYENGHLKYGDMAGGYYSPDSLGVHRFYFYVYDHQHNVRLVLNENKHIEEQNNYYPFGMPHADHLASAQLKKTTGKEWDIQNGLYWLDFGARLYDPVLGSFTTQDPLAEKYYHISPYAYCANNPVNYIDPDGKKIWILNEKGYLLRKKTKDKVDIIQIQRSYPKYDMLGNEINMSIKIPSGSIESVSICKQASNNKKIDFIKVRGDDVGTKLFEFLSKATDVEWSQTKTGKNLEEGKNYIETIHDVQQCKPSVLDKKSDKDVIREINHSHPNGNKEASKKDKDFAKKINEAYHGDNKILFHIFLPLNGCVYYNYYE